MARRLIRQEGLLVGGSSGSAVWAAVELAKEVGPGKRICVILPDSVRNYMTKFLDDAWMRENGFTESRWESNSVGDLLRSLPPREMWTARPEETIAVACQRMKEQGVSQLPVIDDGQLVGILGETDVLTRIVQRPRVDAAHRRRGDVPRRRGPSTSTTTPASSPRSSPTA